jgi:transcriptional regulator with XRE-family HTH domain
MNIKTQQTIQSPLRRERLRRGLTQLTLAIRANCSLNSVSIAERGGKISEAMAQRLAAALHVPVEAICPRGDEQSSRGAA